MPALKGLRSVSLLAALLVLLLGCQPQRPGGRLVVGSRTRIDSVDPAATYSFGALQLISALGDPLYVIDAKGELRPRLATALPRLSPDRLTAWVPLRKGVRFHDGTRFDAAAMVFTLERFLAIGKLSYLLGDRIVSVRASGSHELELKLRRPFTALPQLLSAVSLTPLSPTAYRSHDKRFLNDRFVGTGPYKLTFFADQQQRLEPFADYWGERPANKGLDLVNLSNSTALYGALRSGEVDVLLSTSLEGDQQLSLHQDAQKGRLLEGVGPALEIGYLTLLSDQPPLKNPVVRRAIAHSLDHELISQRVTHGLRPPLRDLVPPSLSGSEPTAWPAYDPAEARRLFEQAGYCRGKTLNLPFTFRSNIPADKLFALIWKEQLRRDLGDCIVLEVSGMESTTAYRQLGEGAFASILLEWMGDYPDADNYLQPLLGCDKAVGQRCLEGPSAASGSFWTRPGLNDDLLLSQSLEGAKRIELLQRLQRETAAAAPYIPVWLVAPRAWAQAGLSTPVFDGSGRVVLSRLQQRPAASRPEP
nr:ABC transporter substrate-binding protein [Synechococcus sp. EJ6-Ellesmere]